LLVNQLGAGGAGQDTAEGESPEPGGWNRFQITVDDLERLFDELKEKSARIQKRDYCRQT
jgi:hypothetical protein